MWRKSSRDYNKDGVNVTHQELIFFLLLGECNNTFIDFAGR